MTTIRRTYTKEFKIEAVRLLTERDYSIREAAESLGVSTNAVRTWRKQLEDEADTLFLARERFRRATSNCEDSRKKTAGCGWSVIS